MLSVKDIYKSWDERFPGPKLSPEEINVLSAVRHKQCTELFDRLQRERHNKATHILAQVPIQVRWRW